MNKVPNGYTLKTVTIKGGYIIEYLQPNKTFNDNQWMQS